MTAEERTQLSRDSIAPVDHRPEDVKQESLYFRAIGHVIHLVTIEIIQVYPGAVPFSRVALILLRRRSGFEDERRGRSRSSAQVWYNARLCLIKQFGNCHQKHRPVYSF
jgi:hypothetical protein